MIKMLTLNIENPSIERVDRLIEWLEKRSEDIFIFTETKNSRGCNKLENYFKSTIGNLFLSRLNYYVLFPKPIDNNYGVMCISKYPIALENNPFSKSDPFYSRYLNFKIELEERIIHILGLYVPSRNQSDEKILRKRSFLTKVTEQIDEEKKYIDVICGDLNIVSKEHIPHYSFFQCWEYDFYDNLLKNDYIDAYEYFNKEKKEYSWVGRTNNGYRYDYFFVSKEIMKYCCNCYFDHSTRMTGISDHSAIILEVKII